MIDTCRTWRGVGRLSSECGLHRGITSRRTADSDGGTGEWRLRLVLRMGVDISGETPPFHNINLLVVAAFGEPRPAIRDG